VRKDYVAVDEASGSDEAAFVERYWTDIWRNHAQAPDLSVLARREEYRLMRPFLDTLPPGSAILDAGCGLGEWTVFLGQQGFDATGLDLSAEVIAKLETRFPGSRFVRGDIRRTGFEPASFAACFSWGAFEHFESGLGECLDEVRRIVRPGGWLFISVPFHNWRLLLRDARPLERWDENFDPEVGYRRAQRFYQWRLTRPELRRELELHGFRTELVVPIDKFTGAGRWLQWDFRLFRPGSRAYVAARRVFGTVLPAGYISHMLFAAAQKR
jgi:SAM-dependent methyltransferase